MLYDIIQHTEEQHFLMDSNSAVCGRCLTACGEKGRTQNMVQYNHCCINHAIVFHYITMYIINGGTENDI